MRDRRAYKMHSGRTAGCSGQVRLLLGRSGHALQNTKGSQEACIGGDTAAGRKLRNKARQTEEGQQAGRTGVLGIKSIIIAHYSIGGGGVEMCIEEACECGTRVAKPAGVHCCVLDMWHTAAAGAAGHHLLCRLATGAARPREQLPLASGSRTSPATMRLAAEGQS